MRTTDVMWEGAGTVRSRDSSSHFRTPLEEMTSRSSAAGNRLAVREGRAGYGKSLPTVTVRLGDGTDCTFVAAVDGSADLGFMTAEHVAAIRKRASDIAVSEAPVRLEATNSHAIEGNEERFAGAGITDRVAFYRSVAKDFNRIYRSPQDTLILARVNGKKRAVFVVLQKVHGYWRINSGTPIDAARLESWERQGRLLWAPDRQLGAISTGHAESISSPPGESDQPRRATDLTGPQQPDPNITDSPNTGEVREPRAAYPACAAARRATSSSLTSSTCVEIHQVIPLGSRTPPDRSP